MLQYYVYIHCKPDGEPFYIGKGKGSRAWEYKHNRSTHHKNIIAKYGIDKIDILVFPCTDERESFERETKWIKELKKNGYSLCNQTDGGEGVSGCKRSDATKLLQGKISKARFIPGSEFATKNAACVKKMTAVAIEKNKKKVECISLNTVFDSLIEAAQLLGLDPGSIGRVCSGKKIKTTGGMTFRFI